MLLLLLLLLLNPTLSTSTRPSPLPSLARFINPLSPPLLALKRIKAKTLLRKAADGAAYELKSSSSSVSSSSKSTLDDLLKTRGRAKRTLERVVAVREGFRTVELSLLDPDSESDMETYPDSVRFTVGADTEVPFSVLVVRTVYNSTNRIEIVINEDSTVKSSLGLSCLYLVDALDDNNDSDDHYHDGLMDMAFEVVEELENRGLFDNNKDTTNNNTNTNTTDLIFRGHSLGGGVAALATCLLSGTISINSNPKTFKSPILKNVRAVVLSCPKCLRVNPNTTSPPPVLNVIYGDDIIPRLTKSSLDRLRKDCNMGFAGSVGSFFRTEPEADSASHVVEATKKATKKATTKVEFSIPGKSYFVKPRKSGEAAVYNIDTGSRIKKNQQKLWCLNDVVVAESLWRHHDLIDGYLRGFERVEIAGMD